jgi:predicted nucleic acid-binding protein
MPVVEFFVDTNIMLYAIDLDPGEDSSDGQDYGGVRVVNPFRA